MSHTERGRSERIRGGREAASSAVPTLSALLPNFLKNDSVAQFRGWWPGLTLRGVVGSLYPLRPPEPPSNQPGFRAREQPAQRGDEQNSASAIMKHGRQQAWQLWQVMHGAHANSSASQWWILKSWPHIPLAPVCDRRIKILKK